uniref:Uncharacterized protein n=1 Tax=Aquila chrysaetos chrysaetos TaxID=223781 RepID=A0A663EZJ3_AQUCH
MYESFLVFQLKMLPGQWICWLLIYLGPQFGNDFYGCADIIRGHLVCPHSWPYMAAIQRRNLTECGGALVEKQ